MRKQLKSFFKGYDFGDLKDELLLKLQETATGKILPVLKDELKEGYSQVFYGTYVHSKLVHAIVMWASAKYLLTVSDIMDNINIQAHLLEADGNEYLQKTITQQISTIESLKSDVNILKKVIIDNNETF
jgi:hypothetical protein